MEPKLDFQKIDAQIDVSFWMKYNKLKLDKFKLSTDPVPIYGSYQLPMVQDLPRDLTIDEYSIEHKDKKTQGGLLESRFEGLLLNTNTIEEFKTLDINTKSKELLSEQFIKDILEEKWLDTPEILNKFLLLSFADLKKYVYQYAYHTLVIDDSVFQVTVSRSKLLHKQYKKDKEGLDKIVNAFLTYISNKEEDKSFNTPFIVCSEETGEVVTLKHALEDPSKHIIFMIDPSPKLPSIILKNLLFAFSTKISEATTFRLISLRDKISRKGEQFEPKHSLYFEVSIDPSKVDQETSLAFTPWSGKNNLLDLKGIFDPESLAKSAVGLNLKLMKWRMVPDLDLEVAEEKKILLLGSGSLGCQIARNLLSWGFVNFTFVDYGNVSFSNPVRQCLFTFQDSIEEKNKAECAAQRLKEVYPLVKTEGIRLSIPMPGHPGKTEEAENQIRESYRKLDKLIQEHDIIYLITDSRESRWLPTVLSAIHNKICMTVALGFETFLAMRHGMSSEHHDKEIHGEYRLGCYFCNDTVAPRNSMQDRTLDRQCTVTRPAMCTMASSISAELLMSLLNHPLRQGAHCDEEILKSDRSVLGIIPHQIRGDMNDYRVTPMCGYSFDMCIACSPSILEQFKSDPEEFLLKACNSPGYLEDVSGITKKMAEINFDDIDVLDDFELDSSEEENENGEEKIKT
ncbi:unnamed protein product [Moneuplotes crassus]|uniref:Ubiquitin-like modifier-activating enzyme ATG7 n=1 Tax=Euplotes crassus TaxID=5936 RepID=A0AAD1U2B8_EUPCR|nr:unnamed protein product [Moneuplotes crassus]